MPNKHIHLHTEAPLPADYKHGDPKPAPIDPYLKCDHCGVIERGMTRESTVDEMTGKFRTFAQRHMGCGEGK